MNSRNAIILVFVFAVSTAQAGLVRYDVSFDANIGSQARDFGSIGHMVFDITPGTSGNIWPNLVDWEFQIDSFLIDSSNTNPFAMSEFFVDAQGAVLFDGEATGTFSTPCFSSDACVDVDAGMQVAPFIFFTQRVAPTSSVGALRYSNVGPQNNTFFGTLTYSEPADVTPVAAPTSLLLLWTTIPLLTLLRRRSPRR